jgi:hypothetical protein
VSVMPAEAGSPVGIDSEDDRDGGLKVGELAKGGHGRVSGVGGEGGEVGVHARGESCSSLSSGLPLSNSTSQQCFTAFLVCFAGGGEADGERAADGTRGEGGAGDGGGARFNGRGSLGVFTVAGSCLLAITVSATSRLPGGWLHFTQPSFNLRLDRLDSRCVRREQLCC